MIVNYGIGSTTSMESKTAFCDGDKHVLCVVRVINKGKCYLVFCTLAKTNKVGSWGATCLFEALVTLLGCLLAMEEPAIDGIFTSLVEFIQRAKH